MEKAFSNTVNKEIINSISIRFYSALKIVCLKITKPYKGNKKIPSAKALWIFISRKQNQI